MFRFFNRRAAANRSGLSEVQPVMSHGAASGGLDENALAVTDSRGHNRRKSDGENVLTIGVNITVQGKVHGCAMLYIEGEADVKINDCGTLVVAEAGRYHGTARVGSAEIAGLVTGNLVCTGRLLLRSTGRIKGKVRYGALEIETGGDLAGNIAALPVKERSGSGESFFGLVRFH